MLRITVPELLHFYKQQNALILILMEKQMERAEQKKKTKPNTVVWRFQGSLSSTEG